MKNLTRSAPPAPATTAVYGRPAVYATRLALRGLGAVLLGGAAAAAGFWAFIAPGGPQRNLGWGLVAAGFLAATWGRGVVARAWAGISAELRVAAVLRGCGAVAVVNGWQPDGRADVDHVVLGPGVVAVETKSGRGPVSVGHDGTVRAGGRLMPGRPVRQVRYNATALGRATGAYADAVLCVVDMAGPPRRLASGVTVCSVRDLGAVVNALPSRLPPKLAASLAARLAGRA